MHFPLKLPGSKRGTFPQIAPHLPRPEAGRGYLIPFFGTGSDSQYLTDSGAAIVACGDANPHFCALYALLRLRRADTLAAVSKLAATFPRTGVKAQRESDLAAQRVWFLTLRDTYNDAYNAGASHTPEGVALFLCVWRAAFNGVARANKSGLINSPPGMTAATGPKASLIDLAALAGFAQWLGTIPPVDLIDYAELADRARLGDVTYYDPPYVGTFDGYFGKRFDHDRLVSHITARDPAHEWAMSNAAHERWARDFPNVLHYPISRSGTVSSKGSKRGKVAEVLLATSTPLIRRLAPARITIAELARIVGSGSSGACPGGAECPSNEDPAKPGTCEDCGLGV